MTPKHIPMQILCELSFVKNKNCTCILVMYFLKARRKQANTYIPRCHLCAMELWIL